MEEHYRVFNNVQEVKFLGSPNGNLSLALAHRFLDSSGSSYYGLEKLFTYKAAEKVFEEVQTFKGTIHDVKIDSSEQLLSVVSGTMPSFTVLHDSKGKPFYMLTNDYKNQVFFAPNQTFVAVVGFGSLNGEIDIWDYKKYERIGYCNSSCASFLRWSSDSAFFLTATVVGKLKVDHKITVFTYNGTPISKIKLDVFDLINVDFAFKGPTNKEITENPQKKKVTTNIGIVSNKMESGKINSLEIQSYNPGQTKLASTAKQPSLQIGAPPKFFNSKKPSGENGFKNLGNTNKNK